MESYALAGRIRSACRGNRCRWPEHGRPGQAVARKSRQRRYLRVEEAGGLVPLGRGDLRDYQRRDQGVRGDAHRGGVAGRARSGCRPFRFQQLGGFRAGLQRLLLQQAAGAGGRTDDLHTAFLRRLLGRAKHSAGGHRPHRGDWRSRRYPVGGERRGWHHQHHHQELRRHAGNLCKSGGGHPGPFVDRRSLRRQAGRKRLLPSLWRIHRPCCDSHHRTRIERRQQLVRRQSGLPLRLDRLPHRAKSRCRGTFTMRTSTSTCRSRPLPIPAARVLSTTRFIRTA